MLKNKRAPTREDFQKCAQVAHEFNELIAMAELGSLLEAENDHAYLCNVGIWYWQLGHRELASACYRRSLKIHPEANTYFNLAVCLDDMACNLRGNSKSIKKVRKSYTEEALVAIRLCYSMTTSAAQRSASRALLRQNGKNNLANARSRKMCQKARNSNKSVKGNAV